MYLFEVLVSGRGRKARLLCDVRCIIDPIMLSCFVYLPCILISTYHYHVVVHRVSQGSSLSMRVELCSPGLPLFFVVIALGDCQLTLN